MSDDAYSRSSRPFPPHGQDGASRDAAPDPLMELARLIGQSDPFGTPPGRGTDAPSPRAPELPTRGPMARPPSSRDASPRDVAPRDMAPRAERYEEKPRYEEASRYEDDEPYEPRPARGHPFPWLQVPPGPAPAVSREASDRSHEQPREAAYRETAYREPPPYSEPRPEPPAAHPSYAQPAPAGYERYEPSFGAPDPAGQPHGYAAEAYPTAPDQPYAAGHYAAEPGHEDHYPRLDDRQHYAAHPQDGQSEPGEHDPRYADPRYAAHDPRYAASEHDEHGEYDPRYAEEGEDGEHDPRYAAAQEDEYDDEYEYADDEEGYADEEPKRRNLLKIALAGGLGLVVLGTAGAFGYRAMFHGGGSDGPPPLIRADNSPTKVVPAPTADASAKSINDRLGSGERMVSREEQPIDLRDARNANGALVAPVGTGGVAPYPTSPTTTSAAPASASPSTAAPTEPKRVRTVTIHADAGAQPNPHRGSGDAGDCAGRCCRDGYACSGAAACGSSVRCCGKCSDAAQPAGAAGRRRRRDDAPGARQGRAGRRRLDRPALGPEVRGGGPDVIPHGAGEVSRARRPGAADLQEGLRRERRVLRDPGGPVPAARGSQ